MGKNKRQSPPINTELKRTFAIDMRSEGVLDAENRIVELSFSSEEPVERWFGREVLLHDTDAVDLSPIQNVGAVLLNHNPDNIVGKPIRVWLDDAEKRGKAIIQFGDTEDGRKAFENVSEGLLRGVSVGYIVDNWRFIDENEEWDRFTGPLDIATKWRVLEISLTPVPADASVGVGRAVEKDKEELMDKEKDKVKEPEKTEVRQEKEKEERKTEAIDLKAEIEKERQRAADIVALCKRHGVEDMADELITKGISVERAGLEILEKMKSKEENKPVGARVEMGVSEREKVRDAMIDGLLARAGYAEREKANEFTSASLLDLAKRSLEVAGVSTAGLTRKELALRAITTTSSDFPIILQNIANKSILDGFGAVGETWSEWCNTGSVTDFKIHTSARVGELDDLEKVPEGGEYKHFGKMAEQQEQYRIAKYGKIFTITREAIINDDLNALTVVPRSMGESAARKISDLAYGVLTGNPTMGDGKALFCSAHNNIASSGSVPTYDSIKEAITAMGQQKDIGGKRRLNIKPKFIIIPSSLEMDVMELLAMQYIDFNAGKPNVLRKYNLNIIADGRLDDAGNAWYLAGPKGKTITLFFLDGIQTPTIEQEQGFTVDGIAYKVRIEAGAKAMHWKALYKNPGA